MVYNLSAKRRLYCVKFLHRHGQGSGSRAVRQFIDHFEPDVPLFRVVPLMASGRSAGETGKIWRGVDPNRRGKNGMHWLKKIDVLEKLDSDGLVVWNSEGIPELKYYLDEAKGVYISDFWDDIDVINSMADEYQSYNTQKPEALLERIIKASSNEGDLVVDFFCGSGTTASVAEKLGRKWIVGDLGKFAIHTTRKRMIGVQRQLKAEGSVVGTNAFMDFVESIQAEGVVLERKAMGEGTGPKTPLVVEVDKENEKKDIAALDIEIPVLTPRIYREYKSLVDLDIAAMGHQRLACLQFSEEEQREIVFKDIANGEITHTTILDTSGVADYRSVIGYFAQSIMKDLRLVSGYDVLYGKVKAFVQDELFDHPVELEDPNTLRNLSELAATKTLIEAFKKAINALTIRDKGDAEIRDTIKLRQTRPFVARDQGYLVPKKSVFNRIIGDSQLELRFAAFLEGCSDVVSFAKNYMAVHFKLDYVNADGDISNYYPDFMVKLSDKRIVIVETKGQEDLDVPLKMARLRQWCEDINRVQTDVKYDFVYVDAESFEKFNPTSFRQLLEGFKEYKGVSA
jgi:hypothetical protein